MLRIVYMMLAVPCRSESIITLVPVRIVAIHVIEHVGRPLIINIRAIFGREGNIIISIAIRTLYLSLCISAIRYFQRRFVLDLTHLCLRRITCSRTKICIQRSNFVVVICVTEIIGRTTDNIISDIFAGVCGCIIYGCCIVES